MARSYTPEEISKAKEFIVEHSRGAAEPLACFWISDGGGAGENYCLECCEKQVASISAQYPDAEVDGGWRTEHDSPPCCETCGARLDGSLTDYGAREELSALTGECEPRFDDADEWDQLANALIDMPHTDLSVWEPVCRTVRRALRQERHAIRKAYLHSMRPGMSEARSDLLSVFGSRMVQKAPEPSFALWDELEIYTQLSHANRWTPDAATRGTGEASLQGSQALSCDGWHPASGRLRPGALRRLLLDLRGRDRAGAAVELLGIPAGPCTHAEPVAAQPGRQPLQGAGESPQLGLRVHLVHAPRGQLTTLAENQRIAEETERTCKTPRRRPGATTS